jgi:DNA-directed RNA polymerase specialized sigma24 family protein
MLGSVSEAEDALQEAWVRLDRRDPGGTDDLRGWLTVVVGRICLDMLRSRKARGEDYAGSWLPEPIVSGTPDAGPERDAILADSVGLALLVVLRRLPSGTPGVVPTTCSRCPSMRSPRRWQTRGHAAAYQPGAPPITTRR